MSPVPMRRCSDVAARARRRLRRAFVRDREPPARTHDGWLHEWQPDRPLANWTRGRHAAVPALRRLVSAVAASSSITYTTTTRRTMRGCASASRWVRAGRRGRWGLSRARSARRRRARAHPARLRDRAGVGGRVHPRSPGDRELGAGRGRAALRRRLRAQTAAGARAGSGLVVPRGAAARSDRAAARGRGLDAAHAHRSRSLADDALHPVGYAGGIARVVGAAFAPIYSRRSTRLWSCCGPAIASPSISSSPRARCTAARSWRSTARPRPRSSW